MKIEIKGKAKEEIQKLYENEKNADKLLRISILGYGWAGPSLGLVLDELKDGDVEVKVDDFNFAVENIISENFGSLTVDYSDSWLRKGFSVYPDSVERNC